MTIKQLKEILKLAPDENKNVYIFNGKISTTEIHWNYDNNNDLDLAEGTNRSENV